MRNAKKILSVLLAVLICITGFAVSSTADIEPLTAYRFETSNYDPSLASNRPTTVKASNDGSVRIKSDHIQQQYQMFFKVTDQKAMKEAIEETCEYYDGFLSVAVSMNSALTTYGSACRPTITINLVDKPHGNIIATTGTNSLSSEQQGTFILDVSRFIEEEYENNIKYVYVQIQCYNWGCGGGLGTQPDTTIYPLKVYDAQEETTIPPIPTPPPDPNQTTFLKFAPKSKVDDNNAPEGIHYSADGAVWRSAAFAKEENYGYTRFTQNLNSREQVQTAFRIDHMYDAAKDALTLAMQGSGYLKVDVTLDQCINLQGEPTIAEVSIGINTKEGNNHTNPGLVRTTAWQYPGTTRTYYLDVSKFTHISEVENVVITVQNYWWYRAGTREMFDWNVESGYGGKENAEALGHVKCEIKPILIISPISVYKGEREDVANTAYDLVLKDFNQNGGVVPDVITLDDPNIIQFGEPEPTETTKSTDSGVTTVTIPGGSDEPVEQSTAPGQTNMTIPPVVVDPTSGNAACVHATKTVVGAKAATYFATGYSGKRCCRLSAAAGSEDCSQAGIGYLDF